MEHKFRPLLWNGLLSLLLTIGAVGCMCTGLGIYPDSNFTLLFCWALTALYCCLFSRLRYGPLILLAAALVSLWLLHQDGSLTRFAFQISMVYDQFYNCGVLIVDDIRSLLAASAEPALIFVGCLCIGVCTLCLNANAGAFFCILIGFLPLAPCLGLPNGTPEMPYLLLLLLAFVLILLTDIVRRRSAQEGVRLGALLLAPALLFVTLCVNTSVPDEKKLLQLQDAVFSLLHKLDISTGELSMQPSVDNRLYTEVTDLTTLGPQTLRVAPVMTVTADYSGTLYLRGQAYDTYDGQRWTVSKQPAQTTLGWPTPSRLQSIGSVTVTTQSTLPLRYFPYYPYRSLWSTEFENGHMINFSSLRQYSFEVGQLNGFVKYTQDENGDHHYCLELPEHTRTAALAYLRSLELTGLDRAAMIRQIVDAVSQSAQYSLNTRQMPYGFQDFAMWFLEESDTGYCVHFATAAVVLLRAAGIPARYVTGYATQVTANKSRTVTQAQAHAWVEYYDYATYCWRVLDPTPATADSTNPGEATTPDTPSTEPPVTETTPPSTGESTPTQTQPPATTTPQQTLPPVTTGGPDQPQQEIVTDRPKSPWLWLLSLPAGAALVAAQYGLRRKLRKKRLSAGPSNARALALWLQVQRYDLALGRKNPPELLELAEKARFSQHTLTDPELAQFTDYLAEAALALQKLPLHRRLFWRLILAIP